MGTTRRSFLKRAVALVGAAVVAPAVIPKLLEQDPAEPTVAESVTSILDVTPAEAGLTGASGWLTAFVETRYGAFTAYESLIAQQIAIEHQIAMDNFFFNGVPMKP